MAEKFLNPDFRDLLHALSAADAKFLVVGGYAMALHGHPRATGDLDIWLEASAENSRRVFDALRAFGAPLADLKQGDLLSPDLVFQIGLPPHRIDILTGLDGVEFGRCWEARVQTSDGDVSFSVIGKSDLIANKRATGRPQDLVDIQALEGETTT